MGSPTVLVIDDVVAIVEEFLTLMRLHQVSAVGAVDLRGAIEALEHEPSIRVISCDVRLDGETGLDILDRIEEHPSLRDRPFRYLFMTGDQMQLDRLHPRVNLKALSKPVQPVVLIQTVIGLLEEADV